MGYPIIFDFLPDIDAFCSDWLGRPLPEEKESKDMSYEVTGGWVGSTIRPANEVSLLMGLRQLQRVIPLCGNRGGIIDG